jgi:hypothetical protein
MKPLNPSLDRLFRAVSAAPQPAGQAPAFGLEARVLAAWRSSRGTTVPGWDMGVLVRGLTVAGLLMAVSIWPAVNQRPNSDSENLQFADSTVQTDVTP